MNNRAQYLIACLVGMYLHANPAVATHIFPAGTESKSVGMESSLRSQGAPSVLYNPANLYLTDKKSTMDPYFEVGMISVDYYYEHPQFDPVFVQVSSPTATIGYTHHFNDTFSAGGVIFPKESGVTEIPGLPRRIGNEVQALNVENENVVTDIGLGFSVSPLKSISLGISAIRTMEKHSLTANALDSESSLIAIEYQNNFDRVIVGARFEPSDLLQISLSAKPEQIKEYNGSQANLGSTSDPKVTNYEPRALSVGLGGWLGRFEWGLEATQYNWSEGSSVVKDGINSFAPDADLKDVVHSAISAGFAFSKNTTVRLSYADLPTPWGEGKTSENGDDQLQGADYGALNAIDRQVIASGATAKIGSYDFNLAAFYANGERKVSTEGANEGFYSISILSLSGAVSTEF